MRILVVSDVHSNLVALEAVVADAGTVDGVWQLGDVVGYGPDPNGVVRRLRDLGAVGVRGNHDAAALGGGEIEWFNPDARRAMEWTRGVLADDAREWLDALPERLAVDTAELVHGSPRQPLWEYILSAPIARENLDRLAGAIGLHGHTHVPLAWLDADGQVELLEAADGTRGSLAGRRALVNPGSVGQPRDGDRRASYLILDPAAGTISWHRVAYDVDAVQRAMRRLPLPPSLSSRLALGL